MIYLFFEVIVRTAIALAKATWRRYPNIRCKKVGWVISYLCWLSTLCLFICISPRRGILFSALYGWFRPADDVLDGDDLSPPKDISRYIMEKSLLIQDFKCGRLESSIPRGEDRLLIAIQCFAKSLGMLDEVIRYVPTIWKHMVDDYTWRTSSIIPTSLELDEFARSQDEAIFRLAALVFGADKEMFANISLDCLGAFTRTDWISDLGPDLRSGLVHLPKEFGFRYEDVTFDNAHNAIMGELWQQIGLEVLATDKLWCQINQERCQLMQAFRFKTLGRLYDLFMISWIEKNHRKNMRRFFR